MVVGVVCSHLVGLIGEEDLVEDLSGLVLNGIHLHQVRGVATSSGAGRERGMREGGRKRGRERGRERGKGKKGGNI